MEKNSKSLPSSGFSKEAVIGLASPKDRLAAAILDIVLLFPLVQLVQAPVKRSVTETFLLGGDPNPWFYRPFSFGVFIVLFVLYHSLMTCWKGQTIGKMFFKIQVISYNGYLGFTHCFYRSLTVVIEFFLLGYPFLALFSHPLRRPIHDRVADSLVIGLKNPTGCPISKEKWQSRFVGNILLVFIIVLCINYKIIKNDQGLGTLFLGEKNRCRAMKQQNGSDLETLLQLYLSHQVSRSCPVGSGPYIFMERRESGSGKTFPGFCPWK